MRSNLAWTLLISSAIINTIADYFAKTWQLSQNTKYFIIAILLWTITSISYMFLLNIEKSMLTSATAWASLSLISYAIIAYITGEPFSARYIVAIVMALCAVILTSF